jgi:hypothetical protein
MFSATLYGEWINYENYDIPSIKINDDLYLFCIHDDKYTKFVTIDRNMEWINGKYICDNIDLKNEKELIDAYFLSNFCVNRTQYNIKDIKKKDKFVPVNCLDECIIFTVWFGNDFTNNRKRGLTSLKTITNCNIININRNNLHHFIKNEYPFHPSFQYLSDIHKSDYIRCYLMHHYGGGYSDIKETSGSWRELFNRLKYNDSLLAIGYHVDGIAYPEENTEEENRKLTEHFNDMIGVGFFIFKSYSELTKKWYDKLHDRLDYYFNDLKNNPAKFSRESKDGSPMPYWEGGQKNTLYPLGWNRILGQILYPLQLYFLKNIQKGIPDRADNGNYL